MVATLLLLLLLLWLQVDVEDIGRVYSLFVDVKRSTQFLIEYQEQYMFIEVPEAAAGEEGAGAPEGMDLSGCVRQQCCTLCVVLCWGGCMCGVA
jgi:hypothetical protein